ATRTPPRSPRTSSRWCSPRRSRPAMQSSPAAAAIPKAERTVPLRPALRILPRGPHLPTTNRAEVVVTAPRNARRSPFADVRRLIGVALLLLVGTAAIGALGRHLAQPARVAAQMPAATSCTPAQVFARMTLAQRVGQLFMVGLKSGVTDEEAAKTGQTISELHAGNVVLYGSTWNAAPALGQVTDHPTKLPGDANAARPPH